MKWLWHKLWGHDWRHAIGAVDEGTRNYQLVIVCSCGLAKHINTYS